MTSGIVYDVVKEPSIPNDATTTNNSNSSGEKGKKKGRKIMKFHM